MESVSEYAGAINRGLEGVVACTTAISAMHGSSLLYRASLYNSMEIPTDLFTPSFAGSRAAGGCAHATELREGNRIYRPRGRYAVPTDQRSAPADER